MALDELRKDLENCVGLMCEVLTEDNTLFYIGTITNYNYVEEEMQINVHKGDRSPRGVIYNTPVKVRVHAASGQEQIMIIYGNVLRCAPKFWRISLEHAVACQEHRENYRQRLRGTALVAKVVQNQTEDTQYPCELVDISLTGICFRTRGVYEVGDELMLTSVKLTERTYSLLCLVRRIQPDGENPSWSLYGCSFLRLRPWLEDCLCKDIFTLQTQALNAAVSEE